MLLDGALGPWITGVSYDATGDAIADGTRQTAELLTRLLAFPGLPGAGGPA